MIHYFVQNRFFRLFILFCMAFSIWIFLYFLNQKAPNSTKFDDKFSLSENPIDEYMEGMQAIRFDINGVPKETLSAQKWYHRRHIAITEMIEPQLSLKSKDGSRWEIQAKTGQAFQVAAHHAIDKVILSNDVSIKRIHQGNDTALWQLLTDSLTFYPKTEISETSSKITILGKQSIIEAIGLKAHLGKGQMELLSEVKSKYYVKDQI